MGVFVRCGWELYFRTLFPLMCDLQHAAVLRSKPPAAGRYEREDVVAPIVEWYTHDHEIGRTVANMCIPTIRLLIIKCRFLPYANETQSHP